MFITAGLEHEQLVETITGFVPEGREMLSEIGQDIEKL